MLAERRADTCAEATSKPAKWLRAGDRALGSVIRRRDDRIDFADTLLKALHSYYLTRKASETRRAAASAAAQRGDQAGLT